MDLGDKKHQVCVLDEAGTIVKSMQIVNRSAAVEKFFLDYPGATIAIEAGSHSPWISRTLESLGCRVLVGNPRKLRFIWAQGRKSDIRDAEMLARIARFDPHLLYPVQHRGEQSQIDLAMLKARDILVKNRTCLINHVRGSAKSIGVSLPSCSSPAFHKKAAQFLPNTLAKALQPIIEEIAGLTERIKAYDREIEAISREHYPETGCLQQITGVGPLTALAFVLTLEESDRFVKSRQVGAFLGLTPKRDQSGETDKQLRITKAGNQYLRRLLVGCSHYILGPFGPDCNLRRFGLRIAERGGKNAKRRATVAVARKLAVLLHRLWQTGEVYEPFYKARPNMIRQAA
jgi:transposase